MRLRTFALLWARLDLQTRMYRRGFSGGRLQAQVKIKNPPATDGEENRPEPKRVFA